MRIKKPDRAADQRQPLKSAGLVDIQIAEKYLQENDKEKAWDSYKQAADRLGVIWEKDRGAGPPFISAVLALSSLSLALGRGLTHVPPYLHRAHGIAGSIIFPTGGRMPWWPCPWA